MYSLWFFFWRKIKKSLEKNKSKSLSKWEKHFILFFVFFILGLISYNEKGEIWVLFLFFVILTLYFIRIKSFLGSFLSFLVSILFFINIHYYLLIFVYLFFMWIYFFYLFIRLYNVKKEKEIKYKRKEKLKEKIIQRWEYEDKLKEEVSDNLLKIREKEIEKNIKKQNNWFVYKKKDFLLTKTELKFYYILKEILWDKYSIFCQIRAIDLIQPLHNDLTSKNKIIQKHIDFVICSPKWFQPKLAIELNDPTHKKSKRYERDNFLDLAFQSAWLPLIFVSTSDMKRKEYLKSLLSDFLEI